MQANQIDLKVDSRYRHFYVNRRHTAAVSYTWCGTSLFYIAGITKLLPNVSEFVWIDVLVLNQFSNSSPELVVGAIERIYRSCKVWVYLDDEYLGRAWCLAEMGQYTNHESGCAIAVHGKADSELKPGADFLAGMDAGVEQDLRLIEGYVLGKYRSKEAFNHAIDCAILRLSPLSLNLEGRYREARQACEQEIEMLQASEGRGSVAMARAKLTLGSVLTDLGEYDSAMESLTDSMGLCGESELELLGDITHRMGIILADQENYTGALETFEESLDLRTRHFGAEHFSVVNSYQCMAAVESMLGNLRKALDLHEKSLDIMRAIVGEEHPYVAIMEINLWDHFWRQGDYVNALLHMQKGLDIYTLCSGTEHEPEGCAMMEVKIGLVLSQLGDDSNALLRFQAALRIDEAYYGPRHLELVGTLSHVARAMARLGNFGEALALHRRALEIATGCLGGGHECVAEIHASVGAVLDMRGELSGALAAHEEALRIRLTALGGAHASVADSKFAMARVCRRQGATAQARRLFGEAGAIYRDALGATHPTTLTALRRARSCGGTGQEPAPTKGACAQVTAAASCVGGEGGGTGQEPAQPQDREAAPALSAAAPTPHGAAPALSFTASSAQGAGAPASACCVVA